MASTTIARTSVTTSGSENRRRASRLDAATSRASVRRISEQPADAILCDLSIYGCRIRSPLDHGAGDRVWLRFAGANPVHATIVWYDKGLAGCRFDAPIDKALFRGLTLNAESEPARCVGIRTR